MFYWSMVSINWAQNEADALLNMMVGHWITLRGFSHAGAFVEMYKSRNQTTVQKSKGLRKKLNSTSTDKVEKVEEEAQQKK